MSLYETLNRRARRACATHGPYRSVGTTRIQSDGDESVHGNWKIAEVTTDSDMNAVASAPSCQARDHRWRPIPVTLFLSVIAMMAYAAYERIGTTANADTVEFTQTLAGGFLAVGMTEDLAPRSTEGA